MCWFLAMSVGLSHAAAAQQLVVEVAVESMKGPSDSLAFQLIGNARAIRIDGTTLAVRAGKQGADTIALVTPVHFTVDLSEGDLLLISSQTTWLKMELLDRHGTMRGAAQKLRVRKHPNSHLIEVRGVP